MHFGIIVFVFDLSSQNVTCEIALCLRKVAFLAFFFLCIFHIYSFFFFFLFFFLHHAHISLYFLICMFLHHSNVSITVLLDTFSYSNIAKSLNDRHFISSHAIEAIVIPAPKPICNNCKFFQSSPCRCSLMRF